MATNNNNNEFNNSNPKNRLASVVTLDSKGREATAKVVNLLVGHNTTDLEIQTFVFENGTYWDSPEQGYIKHLGENVIAGASGYNDSYELVVKDLQDLKLECKKSDHNTERKWEVWA